METFLILRLGAMGDVLHALPAVTVLHRRFPQAQIAWAIEKRWRPLLPDFVSPIQVDTRRWRKDWISGETRDALRSVRDLGGQSVAIDLQGAIKSALLGNWLGPKCLLGPAHPREWPARFLYDGMVETHAAHVIGQAYELVSPALDERLFAAREPFDVFVTAPEAGAAAERIARNGRFAVLNPGAGWRAKEWPIGHYGELARALVASRMTPVINCGPGDEYLGAAIVQACPEAHAVMLSLSELIALLRRASLFVGGDTGPMHLAALLGVPTVALFGPTDPARNGPYYPQTCVLRSAESRTSYRHTSSADPGLARISVQQVLETIREVLA
jgi:heptosyltransferase-1